MVDALKLEQIRQELLWMSAAIPIHSKIEQDSRERLQKIFDDMYFSQREGRNIRIIKNGY